MTALFVVGGSVWAVVKQLQQMTAQTAELRRTVELTAESGLDNLFVPLTQAYLEHPELRAIFDPTEAAPPTPTGDTLLRASALAELVADSMDKVLRLPTPGASKTGEPLLSWINDLLRDRDFLRQWIRSRRTWYRGPLLDLADEIEKQP